MLTYEDFDILIESLDLWAEEPSDTCAKETLTSLMLAKAMGKSESYMMDLIDTAHTDMKRKVRARKEQATLLKARLIQMRDKQAVDDFIGDLSDDT